MLSDSSFNIFYNSGTLIVIYAKPIGQHADWDCCLAAENLMLAAHEMGLGTCPIGLAWPLLERSDVKNNLNVPVDYLPVMPIIVGYPRKPAPSVERKEPDIRCWKMIRRDRAHLSHVTYLRMRRAVVSRFWNSDDHTIF